MLRPIYCTHVLFGNRVTVSDRINPLPVMSAGIRRIWTTADRTLRRRASYSKLYTASNGEYFNAATLVATSYKSAARAQSQSSI